MPGGYLNVWGVSDIVNALIGLLITEMSHFIRHVELGIGSKFFEGVGHQKTILSAVCLPWPRRKPVPTESIQFELRVAPRHTESRPQGPSRMRRRLRLGGSLDRG